MSDPAATLWGALQSACPLLLGEHMRGDAMARIAGKLPPLSCLHSVHLPIIIALDLRFSRA